MKTPALPVTMRDSIAALPAIKALQGYAATAPADDPGEGYWDDMESAYRCGAWEESGSAARLIRDALTALGLAAPAGAEICKGCGRELQEADAYGHAPDCTLEESD